MINEGTPLQKLIRQYRENGVHASTEVIMNATDSVWVGNNLACSRNPFTIGDMMLLVEVTPYIKHRQEFERLILQQYP